MGREHITHVCDGPPCSRCQTMLDNLPRTPAGREAMFDLADAAVSSVRIPPHAIIACAGTDDGTDTIASVAFAVRDPSQPNRAGAAVITDPPYQSQGYGRSATERLGQELVDRGVVEVVADINQPTNPASANLAKSLAKEARDHGVRTLFRNLAGR